MSKLKTIGRRKRRAKGQIARLAHKMEDEKVYTVVNDAGQKKTMRGSDWKRAAKDL